MEYEKLFRVKNANYRKKYLKIQIYNNSKDIFELKVGCVIYNVVHIPFNVMRPSFDTQLLSIDVKGFNIKNTVSPNTTSIVFSENKHTISFTNNIDQVSNLLNKSLSVIYQTN